MFWKWSYIYRLEMTTIIHNLRVCWKHQCLLLVISNNDILTDSFSTYTPLFAVELQIATGNVSERHINWNLTDLWSNGDLLNGTCNLFGKESGARWHVGPEEISQHTPGRQRPQQNWIMFSFLRSLCKELS